MTGADPLRDALRRPLAVADALLNRLYGWRGNPLYQSGALVVVAFLVMLATGLYLLLFYRIGAPWDSVARIDGQLFAGRWIRALHRYAADLAVAAAALHAFRMFVQGRSWGPRALAWLSGLLLLFLLYVCGWTGYVMVWDAQGQLLAVEGARLLDALPIFSEPLVRAFAGDRPVPSAFFFLNLFAHIAFPIGMALLLWVHVSRLSRPLLLPPRPLLWSSLVLLVAASLLVPAPLGREADLQRLPGPFEADAFYAFWLPLSQRLEPGIAWLGFVSVGALLLLAPLWTRPGAAARPAPSHVDPHLCTGCEQCALDCPFDAIAMIPVSSNAAGRAARVDPERCVSCGVCAGSCAPMAVGPPRRSGRDQLAALRALESGGSEQPGRVVLIACRRGAGSLAARPAPAGVTLWPLDCCGNLHSSVVEYWIRSGAAGVLVASCPPRDCRSREGPKWLEERLQHGREAELQERVDRRRVRVVHAAEAESRLVLHALAAFRVDLAALALAEREAAIELETACEPPPAQAAS